MVWEVFCQSREIAAKEAGFYWETNPLQIAPNYSVVILVEHPAKECEVKTVLNFLVAPNSWSV